MSLDPSDIDQFETLTEEREEPRRTLRRISYTATVLESCGSSLSLAELEEIYRKLKESGRR